MPQGLASGNTKTARSCARSVIKAMALARQVFKGQINLGLIISPSLWLLVLRVDVAEGSGQYPGPQGSGA